MDGHFNLALLFHIGQLCLYIKYIFRMSPDTMFTLFEVVYWSPSTLSACASHSKMVQSKEIHDCTERKL